MCYETDRFVDDLELVESFKCMICMSVLCCPQYDKSEPKSKQVRLQQNTF